jgi:putative Mg2+ transporter-C (MgtC) family protein
MILHPVWQDIALRLLLTLLAGAIVGLNREIHGHSAGLRTTMLVGLAACSAMVLANLLLTTTGKAGDSFVNIDVMRLPLGILTGVGFIGGGAIFRRGNLVTGVTTAATLWAITAIGLCFGSGQIVLGLAVTTLTIMTIWLLRRVEDRLHRQHRALITIRGGAAAVPDLPGLLASAGYRSRFVSAASLSDNEAASLTYEVRWRSADSGKSPLDLIGIVGARYAVDRLEVTAEQDHDL